MFDNQLLVRTVPPRPTEQGQKLLALLRQVELLEEVVLGDEQTGSTAVAVAGGQRRQSGHGCCPRCLMSLSDSLSASICRWRMKPALRNAYVAVKCGRRGEYSAAGVAELHGGSARALDYLFVASKEFAQRYFP